MKKILALNAVFSASSGFILMAFQRPIAYFFKFSNVTPFFVVGVALFFFSLTILYEMKRQNLIAILWIIIQDMLWVTASVYWLIFNPFETPLQANIVVAIIAFIVLLFAIYQSAALANFDSIEGKGIKQLRFERKVTANKAESWKVISDVGNYHQVAPNIDSSRIISGHGKGMVRSCSHGKNSWTESCTLWEEEEIYSFIVNTSAKKYPYPFKYLKGTWQVQEENSGKTVIFLTFEFTYKYKILNILIHPFLLPKFKRIVEELFNNWQNILEKKENHHLMTQAHLPAQDLLNIQKKI